MNNRDDLFDSLSLPPAERDQLYKSNPSTSDSLISSASDYQEQIGGILDSRPRTPAPEEISRPISRNSTTSCFSTTATKDGIEGNRLHRYGPTSYSNNIISGMMQQSRYESPPVQHTAAQEQPEEEAEEEEEEGAVAAISPVSLSPLSTTNSFASPPGDKLNIANIELHNSIFRVKKAHGLGGRDVSDSLLSATAATIDDDLDSTTNNYSQVSIKTTNAQVDGEAGQSNHIPSLPSREPPITLREKISLLDTEAVERGDTFR